MKFFEKIGQWYFTRKALPYWVILATDCFCVLLSCLCAYYIKRGGDLLAHHFWQVFYGGALSLVFFLLAFRLFHTYSSIIRYSSFIDLLRIVKAMLLGSILTLVLIPIEHYFGLSDIFIAPQRSGVFFIFVAGTMLICLSRIVAKNLYEAYHTERKRHHVFIYGTQAGGVALAHSILNTPDSEFALEGMVSNEPDSGKNYLFGKKVVYDSDELPDVMQKCGADVLLVSPVQADYFRKRVSLIDALINAGIKIMMNPQAEEWDGKSELSHNQLREVDIEDLLPRDKIEVDMNAIGSMLCGKRILITGAAGSIGSEIARQVAKFLPQELILVDQAETPMHDVRLWMNNFLKTQTFSDGHAPKIFTIVGSITNQEHMEQIFSEHHPDYVFHAAAYKHVPMMEDNPAIAIQNNVYGTRVIADLAVKYETKKFVMISTDKAVNPTNVMGCSKRICEIYCQALNSKLWEETQRTGRRTTQFITTRFGNVLGSNGSVIPIFKDQIRKGGPVMVTHPDIIRYFMLIPEACRLVLEAGTMGKGGEIFVFDMGEPVKIVDLAKRMIRLSGAKNVEIKFSGLRDGEKLYEEVLNDEEQTKPTVHPKIKVATVREYPYELALQNEIELHKLSYSFDDMEIVRKMKQIVPEYKSQNSKYQELD